MSDSDKTPPTHGPFCFEGGPAHGTRWINTDLQPDNAGGYEHVFWFHPCEVVDKIQRIESWWYRRSLGSETFYVQKMKIIFVPIDPNEPPWTETESLLPPGQKTRRLASRMKTSAAFTTKKNKAVRVPANRNNQ